MDVETREQACWYLAALIDGEGHIRISKNRGNKDILNSYNPIFTEEEIEEIKNHGGALKPIASKFGISIAYASQIRSGSRGPKFSKATRSSR